MARKRSRPSKVFNKWNNRKGAERPSDAGQEQNNAQDVSCQSREIFVQAPAPHRPKVKLPKNASTTAYKRRQTRKLPRPQRQSKQMLPSMAPDPSLHQRYDKSESLLLDRRDFSRPGIGLVLLPVEPDIPRRDRAVPHQPFRFLDLPGELRNKVYDHVFPPIRYAIDWLADTQKSKSLTYRLPTICRALWPHLSPDTILRRRILAKEHRTPACYKFMNEIYRRPSQIALLFVNRQLHREAASIFYSVSKFSFDLLGTLRHFLNVLTPESKQALRTLTLTYNTYGHPAKTSDQCWKVKNDLAWENLCWRVSDELPALTDLTLHLNLRRSPLCFAPLDQARYDLFGTEWMMPLWAFQGIRLKTCWLRIYSDITEDPVLAVESRRLRQQILGENWDQAKEFAERDWFGSSLADNPFYRTRRSYTSVLNTLVLNLGHVNGQKGGFQ